MSRSLLVLLVSLLAAKVLADEREPTKTDARASCLRTCAGAPRDADGKKLLACLKQCDAPVRDAGQP